MAVRFVILCAGGRPGCRRSPESCAGCRAAAGTDGRGRCCRPCLLRRCPACGAARPGPGNPDLLQHRREPGAVGPLPRCDDQGQRAAAAVRAQVDLACEAAARTPQALVSCTTSTSRSTRLCRGVSSWCSTASSPGAGRVLVRAHDGGIHRDVPVDLADRVGCCLELLQQSLPGAVRRPEPMALVDRLPRPEPLRQIAPVHPGPHPVQDPVITCRRSRHRPHRPLLTGRNGRNCSHSTSDRSPRSPRPMRGATIRPGDSHVIGRTAPGTDKVAAFGPATTGLPSESGTGLTARRPVPPRLRPDTADTPGTGRTTAPGRA